MQLYVTLDISISFKPASTVRILKILVAPIGRNLQLDNVTKQPSCYCLLRTS